MVKKLKKEREPEGNWITKAKPDPELGVTSGLKEGQTLHSAPAETFTDERGEKWPIDKSFAESGGTNISFKQILLDISGQKNIEKPYKESPYIHAPLKVFAQAMSSVSLMVYENDTKEAKPLPSDHPVMKLLRKPNPLMTGSMLIFAHAIHRKLDGEDFWFMMDGKGHEIRANAQGKIPVPEKIWPVRGSLVKQKVNNIGEPDAYSYPVQLGDGKTKDRVFSAESVIRFADYDPYDVTRGLGDVETVARQLDLMFQAERYQSGVLKNNGDPGGWVKTKHRLTTQQKEDLQRQVDSTQSNPDNARKYRVVDSDAEYIPNKMSPKDMEYSLLLKYGRDSALTATGVPPPLVGVWEYSTYNNVAEAKRDLWLGGNGVMAVLRQIEDVLNVFFIPRLDLPGSEKWVARFDVSSVEALKKDVSTAVESAARSVKTGIGLNFNEVAEMIGLDFIPPASGSTHYVSPDLIAVPGKKKEGEESSDVIGSRKLVDSNTAQVIVNLISQIQAGNVPRESGVQILVMLYGFDQSEAEKVVGPAGEEKPEGEDEGEGEEGEGEEIGEEVDVENDEEEETDEEEDEEDAEKAHLTALQKEYEELYENILQKCLIPSTRDIKPAAVRFLRSYKKAYLTAIRALAGNEEKSLFTKALSESEREFIERIANSLQLDPTEWVERLSKISSESVRRAYLRALSVTAKETSSFALPMTAPEIVEAVSTQLIKLSEGEVSRISSAVRESMLKVLEESAAAGGVTTGDVQLAVRDSLEKLEASVTGAFKDLNQRALTIARTEATQATNSARMAQFKEAGVEEHQWLNAGIGEIREAHQDQPNGVGGEIVKLGEKFSNGLRYPGDPGGPAEEVANCRCITKGILA